MTLLYSPIPCGMLAFNTLQVLVMEIYIKHFALHFVARSGLRAVRSIDIVTLNSPDPIQWRYEEQPHTAEFT